MGKSPKAYPAWNGDTWVPPHVVLFDNIKMPLQILILTQNIIRFKTYTRFMGIYSIKEVLKMVMGIHSLPYFVLT